MNSFEIKAADPSDAAVVLQLTGRLSRESKTVTIDPNWSKLSVSQEARQINLINHTPGNVIIIIRNAERAIGIVTVQEIKSQVGELGVAVEKRFWNLGLGTRLVREALRWFRIYSNLMILTLTVERQNQAAIHVYRKCGFRTIGSKRLKNRSVVVYEMKISRNKR